MSFGSNTFGPHRAIGVAIRTTALAMLACASLSACGHDPRWPAAPAFLHQATSASATAACTDWRAAQIDHPLDPLLGNRLLLGCSTAANLLQMVDDPADLSGSRTLAPAEGQASSAALQRYYTDKAKPLPTRKSALGEQ
jgi:hypothetical protein